MALALAAVTAATAPPGRERTAKTLQVAEAATGRQPRAGEAVLLGKAEAMSRCGRGKDSEPSARIRPQLCCQWLQELGANGHGTMQHKSRCSG
jgi:hypothetical protein